MVDNHLHQPADIPARLTVQRGEESPYHDIDFVGMIHHAHGKRFDGFLFALLTDYELLIVWRAWEIMYEGDRHIAVDPESALHLAPDANAWRSIIALDCSLAHNAMYALSLELIKDRQW